MLTSDTMSCHQITRRVLLKAGAVMVTANPVLAQPPAPAPHTPRVKGPPVWLDMDQAELDAAYDQSVYAPNLPQLTRALRHQQRGRAHALGCATALCLWGDPR
jgi:hypothetical protein